MFRKTVLPDRPGPRAQARRKSKLLFISSLYEPYAVGGAERVLQSLAEGFAATGHECVVATLCPSGSQRVELLHGVRVYYLPMPNVYWPFFEVPRGRVLKGLWHFLDGYNALAKVLVARVIDQERPELVNTHNISGFSIAIWDVIKTRGLPLVHTLHDQYLLCPRTTMHRDGVNCRKRCWDCRVATSLRTLGHNFPDLVIGPSRFILDRHREWGVFQDIPSTVIRYGYDRPHDFAAERSPTPEPEAKIRFGFLGRIHPTKGLHQLVEAFSRLPESTAHLWIAGRGSAHYEASLKQLTSARSDVHWLGYVEPGELLRRIDVLVVPSLWEDTAPRVILEAFAYGVPVLGSRRGGIPELIEEGAGWVFDPDEPGALHSALAACIGQRATLPELRRKALEASSRFTSAAQLEAYRQAFSALGVAL